MAKKESEEIVEEATEKLAKATGKKPKSQEPEEVMGESRAVLEHRARLAEIDANMARE